MKKYNLLVDYFTDLIDKKWFEKVYTITTSILVLGFIFEYASNHLLEKSLGSDIFYQLAIFFAINSVITLSVSVTILRSLIKYSSMIFKYTIGKFFKNKEKKEELIENGMDFLMFVYFVVNGVYISLFLLNIIVLKFAGIIILPMNLFLSLAGLILLAMLLFVGYCSYQTPDSYSYSENNIC